VIRISPAPQAAVGAKVITIPSWTGDVGAWYSVRSDSSDRSLDFLIGDGPEVTDRGIVFIVWVNEIIIGRRSKEYFLEYLAFAFVVLFSIRAGVLFGLRVLDVLILVWIWSVGLLVAHPRKFHTPVSVSDSSHSVPYRRKTVVPWTTIFLSMGKA
jgi:hypothetical protein